MTSPRRRVIRVLHAYALAVVKVVEEDGQRGLMVFLPEPLTLSMWHMAWAWVHAEISATPGLVDVELVREQLLRAKPLPKIGKDGR